MKLSPLIILSTLLVIFSGCAATPPPYPITNYSTENRIGPNDVVAVNFDGPRPVIDTLFLLGGPSRIRYDTTAEWDAVFAGTNDAKWKFKLNHAKLEQQTTGMGFAARLTYDVYGTLTDGKHTYHVTGTGSRAAGFAIPGAMRQAIELGIVNVAQHCKTLIAQTSQMAKD